MRSDAPAPYQDFDCICAYGHGITMGSEMSGGIEDVVIWDCDLWKFALWA